MELFGFERNADKVKAVLIDDKAGDKLITTKPCKIYIPESYRAADLAVIGETIKIIGCFAIVVENKYYAYSNAIALMEICPSETNTVMIGKENYLVFYFEENSVVCKDLNLIKNGVLVSRLHNHTLIKANVPVYMDYPDICFLFETADLHGGVNLKTDSAILELISASIVRQKTDKTKFYRHLELTDKDADKLNMACVSMTSVAYSTTNTTTKLVGAYLDEGITSALIYQSNTNESIETVLRS